MAAQRYRKILVPVDGSGWAQRAIPHAIDIARSNNSELILLHVFRPPAIEYADQLALAHQAEQMDEMRAQVKQYLTGLASELRDESIPVKIQMLEGPGVAALILDYIKAQEIDLVVMSTHGRTGLAKLLMGSIANEVMHGADVPVLLVRPDKEKT
jgi:nucleotide-binding universal stress UspA family protein